MKKLVILLACTSIIAGCASLGPGGLFDGLSVSVDLVDPDTGATWSIASDEAGLDIEGTYVDSHGTTWVLGEGIGAVTATTRNGVQIAIVPEA